MIFNLKSVFRFSSEVIRAFRLFNSKLQIFPIIKEIFEPVMSISLPYPMAILAFCVESFLFAWHLDGRDQVNVMAHTLLVYTMIFCIVATALEMILENDVRPALARATGLLWQGVWFCIAGFLLHSDLVKLYSMILPSFERNNFSIIQYYSTSERYKFFEARSIFIQKMN